MLTKDDLNQIKMIIRSELQEEITPVKKDTGTLKSDVRTMKSDIAKIRASQNEIIRFF